MWNRHAVVYVDTNIYYNECVPDEKTQWAFDNIVVYLKAHVCCNHDGQDSMYVLRLAHTCVAMKWCGREETVLTAGRRERLVEGNSCFFLPFIKGGGQTEKLDEPETMIRTIRGEH